MSFTISKLILRIKGTTLKAFLSSLLHEHSIQCCHSGDAPPKTSTTTCTAARADAMTCRCDRHLANTCAQRSSRPDATHTCHKLAIVASTCILYAGGVWNQFERLVCARSRARNDEWMIAGRGRFQHIPMLHTIHTCARNLIYRRVHIIKCI